MSNVLLATHEQEGVQLQLDKFDTFVPDAIANWFINLQMGASVELDTDLDPYGEYGLDPNGPAPAGNLVWQLDMLLLDPTGQDASHHSVPGFTVAEGPGSTTRNDRRCRAEQYAADDWAVRRFVQPAGNVVPETRLVEAIRGEDRITGFFDEGAVTLRVESGPCIKARVPQLVGRGSAGFGGVSWCDALFGALVACVHALIRPV